MSTNDLSQLISSLSTEDKTIITSLHETALALGYAEKISPAGQKPGDWKCEYIAAKPKRVLYVLRISGQQYSVCAKLFHIAEYIDVLESCTEHCRTSMLTASKNCGSHGGRCAGPVSFATDGKTYSKCRHNFRVEGITNADLEGIQRLLKKEAEFREVK